MNELDYRDDADFYGLTNRQAADFYWRISRYHSRRSVYFADRAVMYANRAVLVNKIAFPVVLILSAITIAAMFL